MTSRRVASLARTLAPAYSSQQLPVTLPHNITRNIARVLYVPRANSPATFFAVPGLHPQL